MALVRLPGVRCNALDPELGPDSGIQSVTQNPGWTHAKAQIAVLESFVLFLDFGVQDLIVPVCKYRFRTVSAKRVVSVCYENRGDELTTGTLNRDILSKVRVASLQAAGLDPAKAVNEGMTWRL